MTLLQKPPVLERNANITEGTPGDPAATTLGTAPAPRKPGRLWAGLCLVAALGGAAWFYVRSEKDQAPTPAASAAALPQGQFRLTEHEIHSLRIEPVQRREFRTERMAEGRIAYNEDRSTPVFSPYTGRVVRPVARLGAEVSPSDTLFEIETNDLVQATNDLLAALDNAAKARTTLDLAERNQARQLELFTARAASRREWEQALADATNAAADLRVAETGLSAARDKLRVLGRSLDQIQAIETSRTVEAVVAVRAPIGGTVVQRRVGPGQWLVTGQGDPVFTIADLSTMWLVAAVRELDAPLIRVGQEVSVTVAALPQHTFRARITTLGTGLDSTTRRLSVRAEIEDPDRLLRPEMSATFRIMVGAPTENIGLPISALIHRGAETHVWAALPDQRFELRHIKTGTRAGDMVEVTEGLQPGDRVVTGGALFVDRAARID